jgi:hypothetical protein
MGAVGVDVPHALSLEEAREIEPMDGVLEVEHRAVIYEPHRTAAELGLVEADDIRHPKGVEEELLEIAEIIACKLRAVTRGWHKGHSFGEGARERGPVFIVTPHAGDQGAIKDLLEACCLPVNEGVADIRDERQNDPQPIAPRFALFPQGNVAPADQERREKDEKMGTWAKDEAEDDANDPPHDPPDDPFHRSTI